MNVKNLDDIVEGGLCTGCGICESMVGQDTIEMKLTPEQRLRPYTKLPIENADLRNILEVCPGVTIRGPEEDQIETFGPINKIFGPILSLYRGWASDEKVRFHAAAGGGLTALGIYLLDSHEVEAVLHVQASGEYPLESNSYVSTTSDQVFDGAQSRYGPAAPLTQVNRLLEEGKTFAVIAKPCDVAAIHNLRKIDARIEKQIPYLLTMFCGGVPSLRFPMEMAAHFGVTENNLSLFRWRGEGWPGMTHMETLDGRSFDLTYDESYFDETAPWTYDTQFRCKICPDAIGELADVVCPDGWIMKDGKPIHLEAPGVNIFVSRTRKGEALLRRAKSVGAIALEPFSEVELIAMHADHIPRKIGWPARILGLWLAGKPAIKVTGYRKYETMMTSGLVSFFRNLIGTYRRVRKGVSVEVGFRN